jgi:hypothetical protein
MVREKVKRFGCYDKMQITNNGKRILFVEKSNGTLRENFQITK